MNRLSRFYRRQLSSKETLTISSFALGYVVPPSGNGHVIIGGQTRSVLPHADGQSPEY
jgi:hypothetical protein